MGEASTRDTSKSTSASSSDGDEAILFATPECEEETENHDHQLDVQSGANMVQLVQLEKLAPSVGASPSSLLSRRRNLQLTLTLAANDSCCEQAERDRELQCTGGSIGQCAKDEQRVRCPETPCIIARPWAAD